jgi:hypothetical protein
MPTINISPEAHRAIRSEADLRREFLDLSRPSGRGLVSIDIDQEVADRLAGAALAGETASETIIRLVAFKRGGGRAN